MYVSDEQAVTAMKILKDYCAERKECEGCNLTCAELKKGICPSEWIIPDIYTVQQNREKI